MYDIGIIYSKKSILVGFLTIFPFNRILFISAVFVCMLSTFWVMSPATIHKEFKMLDIISIDYNPLMTILRIAKTKS